MSTNVCCMQARKGRDLQKGALIKTLLQKQSITLCKNFALTAPVDSVLVLCVHGLLIMHLCANSTASACQLTTVIMSWRRVLQFSCSMPRYSALQSPSLDCSHHTQQPSLLMFIVLTPLLISLGQTDDAGQEALGRPPVFLWKVLLVQMMPPAPKRQAPQCLYCVYVYIMSTAGQHPTFLPHQFQLLEVLLFSS